MTDPVEPCALIAEAQALLAPRRLGPNAEAGSVGAVVVSAGGRRFHGVCIDTACGMGFCAEHAAIAAMVTAGESRISRIVAVSDRNGGTVVAPCGRCREFMWQIDPGNAQAQVILGPDEIVPLAELLPRRWQAEP